MSKSTRPSTVLTQKRDRKLRGEVRRAQPGRLVLEVLGRNMIIKEG